MLALPAGVRPRARSRPPRLVPLLFAALLAPGRALPAEVRPRARSRPPRVSNEALALARAGQAGSSPASLLEGVPAGEPRAKLFRGAIKASAERGWRGAVFLLRSMPDHAAGPPCTIAYNLAMRACVRNSAAERALELMDEMASLADGARPDQISYGTAINAAAKSGQWKRGVELLAQMREAGLPANVLCYAAAISGCASVGEWRTATDLLVEMRAAGAEPSLSCYNAAISACDKGGQPDFALVLLDRLSPGLLTELRALGLDDTQLSSAAEAQQGPVQVYVPSNLDLDQSGVSEKLRVNP